jgi:RHS repeat-associated protein
MEPTTRQGIGGDLSAIHDSAGTTAYQLANLHGDVIGTSDTAGTLTADTPGGLTLMGVRLYNPTTGRFLSTEPVAGGNANAYEYCSGDPVNCVDLDGRLGKKWKKWLKRAARAAQYMPGFIGTAANIGWAGYYAYKGQWGKAAVSGLGAEHSESLGIPRWSAE